MISTFLPEETVQGSSEVTEEIAEMQKKDDEE